MQREKWPFLFKWIGTHIQSMLCICLHFSFTMTIISHLLPSSKGLILHRQSTTQFLNINFYLVLTPVSFPKAITMYTLSLSYSYYREEIFDDQSIQLTLLPLPQLKHDNIFPPTRGRTHVGHTTPRVCFCMTCKQTHWQLLFGTIFSRMLG